MSNHQERLQDVWARTDKPLIDIMTKKTCRSPAVLVTSNCSSDESNDSESLDSSCGVFVAVPKEFRPHVPSHPEETKRFNKVSLNENVQSSSIQNSKSASRKPTEDALSKIPQSVNPNGASAECKQISFTIGQSETPSFVKEEVTFKNTGTSQKCSRIAKNIATDQNTEKTAEIIKDAGIKGQTSFQQPQKKVANNSSFRKQHSLVSSHPKEVGRKNKKNGLKYEYVEKQVHGTIRLNFEMPSAQDPNSFFNDGLKYEAKFVQNMKQQKAAVLKTGDRKFRSGAKRDYEKGPYHVSFQNSVVKWDSSLSLDDHSSDSQDKVEWTVVQERKTFVSARKVKDDRSMHKQQHHNERPSRPCNSNQVRKPTKRYFRPRKPRNSSVQDKTNFNQHGRPKTVQKHSNPNHNECRTEIPFYRNDLHVNNNLKYAPAKIQNSDSEKDPWNVDDESFTRQCTVRQRNFTDQRLYPSFSNDELKSYEADHNVMEQNLTRPMMSPHRNLEDFSRHREPNTSGEKTKLKDVEKKKDSVLKYGREMSDLIIGSHTALSMFISFYKEWQLSRRELIVYFEQLEKNLRDSSKKFTKYKDMLQIVNTGATLATAVPLPHVSIAAKIVSVLTGLFSAFLNTSEKKKAEVEDSNEITTAVFKDTHASTELYMYGLQCHQQFEETAKLIEEFHLNAANPEIFEDESHEIATFIRGVLEYKPNHRIFYRKLHKCFQELLQTGTSDFSRRFCEPFLLYPSTAVEVIGFLDWRFRYEDFNGESVRYELEQIHRLLDGNSTSIKDLVERIQNCIRILRDELAFVEGCVKDISLFDSSAGQSTFKLGFFK